MTGCFGFVGIHVAINPFGVWIDDASINPFGVWIEDARKKQVLSL